MNQKQMKEYNFVIILKYFFSKIDFSFKNKTEFQIFIFTYHTFLHNQGIKLNENELLNHSPEEIENIFSKFDIKNNI